MKLVPPTARRAVAVAVAGAAIAGLALSTAAAASTSSGATSSGATSSGNGATSARVIPRCTGRDLGVWVAVDQGNGAAGTIYFPLEFTNLSHHTCYLFGYPGVSALDANSHQLGSPADWGPRTGARIVNLAPGATAHTILGYHDVAVSTESACAPVKLAVDLRIYPPGQRTATDANFAFDACSRRGPVYMTIIRPIVSGVGTING